MSLSLHFRLSLDVASEAKVCRLLIALRKEAIRLGYQRASGLRQLPASAPSTSCDTWSSFTVEARALVRDPDRPDVCHEVEPLLAIGFRAWPAFGDTHASLALCSYPATIVRPDGSSFPTRLPPWCWRSSCKTEAANDAEYGGVVNFVRCHLGVVALLDAAVRIGFRVEVVDDAEYWEKRDVLALAGHAKEHGSLMAIFAATMYGLSRDHGDLLEAIGLEDSGLSKVFKLIWLTRTKQSCKSSESESYL